MIEPKFAYISVSPNIPLEISASKNTLPIVAGHNNQYKKFSKKNIFNLTEAFPIRLKKVNKYYKAGPLVGILTTKGPNGFKGNRQNYTDLVQMGMKTGILIYIFTAESLDKDKKNVDGYFYFPNKKMWIKKKMPLPDVVYNRISSKKEENKPETKEVINFLKNENIPFFNHQFFDKWTLNEWMQKSIFFSRFIPDTAALSQDSLRKMLNDYQMLYLKPIYGKAGIGFIKIKKNKNIYLLTYQSSRMILCKKFYDFRSLWEYINSLINKKNYIIQRGIKLKKYLGNPYDIRVLVQKNGEGIWKISGIGIRIAGEKSITTHVPRGGHIETPDKVFNYSFGKYASDWKSVISKISIEIAKQIENQSGNCLGELSLDLGIDDENHLWFFEANSKPMKFDESDIRYISLLRLMQYFRFLTGFTD